MRQAALFKLSLIGTICAMALAGAARADGTVSDISRCGGDMYVVQAPDGFIVIEWYSGHPLAKGDTIIGNMDSLGMKNVTLSTGDKLQIYIDGWGLNQPTAVQILNVKCGKPPPTFP